MIVIDLAFVRIKQVIRSKEFYFYVIGFPLFFLILFGFLSGGWAPVSSTIDIGYYTTDTPITDPITGETMDLESKLYQILNTHESEKGLRTFSISNYSDLAKMDDDIQGLVIQGGLEIPYDFSLQAGNITRFYASMLLTQLLVEAFELYPAEFSGINASIVQIAPYLQGSANLTLRFHGDVTLQSTMQAYTSTWQILSEFLSSYTYIHANSIWNELKAANGLSFELNLTSEPSENTIITDVRLVSAGTGDVVEDFKGEFFAKLLPGQIMQTILTSAVSAVWLLDQENKTGMLKRLKLTKLSSIEYLGSILLAWSVIATLQGLFMLTFSAILGFFNFALNPLAWLFMIVTMVLLGLTTAMIALLAGSFIEARVATPILILFASTVYMFVGEYFFEIPTAFTFAGKNFSWFDFIFLRPAFLVMKNSILLENTADAINILFDLLLLFLWFVVIFAVGATLFNKFKLRYAEKE